MSAGNHAQGVAYHARRLGIPATIVMPKLTPFVKVENTRQFGARVVLEGEGVDEAARHAWRARRRARPDLRPSLDDRGDHRGPGHARPRDAGGRARTRDAGGADRRRRADRAASRPRPRRSSPAIEIIGVEAALYPSMYRRAARRCRRAPAARRIADGIAVKEPGNLTCRSSSAWSTRSCWSRRPRSRPRSCSCWRSRSSWPRAPAPPASPRSSSASRPLPRPPASACPVRRQHRQPPAVGGHPARPGRTAPPGPAPGRDAGRAGQPGQDRGPIIAEARRQHRRRPAPAGVLAALGQARRCRLHHRDAQRRPRERGRGHAARGGLPRARPRRPAAARSEITQSCAPRRATADLRSRRIYWPGSTLPLDARPARPGRSETRPRGRVVRCRPARIGTIRGRPGPSREDAGTPP